MEGCFEHKSIRREQEFEVVVVSHWLQVSAQSVGARAGRDRPFSFFLSLSLSLFFF